MMSKIPNQAEKSGKDIAADHKKDIDRFKSDFKKKIGKSLDQIINKELPKINRQRTEILAEVRAILPKIAPTAAQTPEVTPEEIAPKGGKGV